MEPRLQRSGSCEAPSPELAMQVPEDSVARPRGSTSHCYFYLSITALVGLVAVTTILILIVQKTDPISSPTNKVPLKGGNCSEDLLCILRRAPFKKTWANLQVSTDLNSTKLSWNKDSIIHGVRYQDGNLVIQIPGWYFIICHLQFLVQCSDHSVDLKLELLVNAKVKKQALVTVCESETQTRYIYQNLSQFLLDYFQVNTTISVTVNRFQYVDTHTFPLENMLSIFLYSS